MTYKDIPIYIINHNRLDVGFKSLVTWLQNSGHKKIIVIDNGSTYSPLLEFYKQREINVIYQGNKGPWTFWEDEYDKNLWYPKSPEGYYVVTDPDVCPSADCPDNLLEKMVEVFERTAANKVGPGFRFDNIPSTFYDWQHVIMEGFERSKLPGGDCCTALIDTTFALYNLKNRGITWEKHYRLRSPYLFEHRPWYEDSQNLTSEEKFYKEHSNKTWATGERTRQYVFSPQVVNKNDVSEVLAAYARYHVPKGELHAILWDRDIEWIKNTLNIPFSKAKELVIDWVRKDYQKKQSSLSKQ
jgi:hypothetical protein